MNDTSHHVFKRVSIQAKGQEPRIELFIFKEWILNTELLSLFLEGTWNLWHTPFSRHGFEREKLRVRKVRESKYHNEKVCGVLIFRSFRKPKKANYELFPYRSFQLIINFRRNTSIFCHSSGSSCFVLPEIRPITILYSVRIRTKLIRRRNNEIAD